VKRDRVHVRDGAAGRRLIVDGTFASFYRPGSPLTGCVWDAIAAPVLALPPARRRRVLVLGLGGGSAARIVRAVAPAARIVGVELDEAVVRAAREHLDLDELGVELVQEDALAFLRKDADPGGYDAILEDVFVGSGRRVRKPDWLPRPGLELAAARLAPGGVLVSNTLDEAPAVSRFLCRAFPAVLRLEVVDYDNRIFAAGRRLPDAAGLRAALERDPVLADSVPRLRFRTVSPSRRGTAARPG
jgi:spermidine synthase